MKIEIKDRLLPRIAILAGFQERTLARLRADFDALTPREREAMMVAAGRLNKQIAWDLRLSEATVKAHRTPVMHKRALGRWPS